MPSVTSGLQRDIRLVRRRAWLFLPFLLLGIIVALFVGRVTGDASATASLSLDTVQHDALVGGDRGLRVFEAQSMTFAPEFKEKVAARAGVSDLDYARYAISLLPISVADGVSRGILTVSISDEDKATAERLRDAWVAVFVEEFTGAEGLFRTRFLQARTAAAARTEELYQEMIALLKTDESLAALPIDELVRPLGLTDSLIGALNAEDSELRRMLAEVRAGIAAGASDLQASVILGREVAPGQGFAELEARAGILELALEDLEVRRLNVSDTAFSKETLTLLDEARGLWTARARAFEALNNARVAIANSASTVEASYSSSGGISGTLTGRIAVVIAITLVFGLIAIYLLEWLSQVRSGAPAEE
jgi:hypothetical protein